MLFPGVLYKHIFSWAFIRTGEPLWTDQRLGETEDYRNDQQTRPDNVKSKVRLFELPAEEYSPTDHILKYVGTFLHEMVHSLIAIYVCDCVACHVRMDNPDGLWGHGKGWAEVAASVQYFAKEIRNIKVELGVLKCISLEMVLAQQSPHEWPVRALRVNRHMLGKYMRGWRRDPRLDATKEEYAKRFDI